MGEQLDLIQGLYEKDEKTYSSLALANRIIKNVKYFRSKVAATQGAYDVYDSEFAALTDVANELDEAVHRLGSILFLTSMSLPEFKGLTIAEFARKVETSLDYGLSEPRSFALLYKLSSETRTSLRSEGNRLLEQVGDLDPTGILRKDVEHQLNKIKTCLKLAEIVLRTPTE